MSLVFGIRTYPNPLQASHPGKLEVVLSASKITEPYKLKDLVIWIKVGSYAQDLTASTDVITVSRTEGWNVRMEGASCHATPDQPKTIAGHGYVIAMDNILVNKHVGTTQVTIEATNADGVLTSTTLDVVKFPETFTLSELIAQPEWVENGQPATLMWTGTDLPDLVYRLHYVTDDQPVMTPVPWLGPFTTAALTNGPNTPFTLEAVVEGHSVTRQCTVAVRPRQPEVAELSGTFLGDHLTIRWKTRYAEYCLLSHSSVIHAIAGKTEPLLPDRLNYAATAVFTPRRTTRELRLGTRVAVSARLRRTDDGDPQSVVAAPNGSLLIAGGNHDTWVYDARSLRWPDQSQMLFAGFTRGYGIAFAPDSQHFFVGGHGDQGMAAALYRADLTVVMNMSDLWSVDGAAYTPNGAFIYVIALNAGILKLDAENLGQLNTPFPHERYSGNGICIAADGRTIYVTGTSGILARDADSGALIHSAAVDIPGPTVLRFWDGPGKQYVIAGTRGGRVHVFTPALEPVDTGNALDFDIHSYAMTAAELLLVKAGDAQHVFVFDLASLQMKQTLDLASPSGIAHGGSAIFTVNGDVIARNVPA